MLCKNNKEVYFYDRNSKGQKIGDMAFSKSTKLIKHHTKPNNKTNQTKHSRVC